MFCVLLVLVGIFALASSNVSAQSVQQFVTSTTSTTVSSYTSTVTSLSTTVITGISYSTQTLSGTFQISVTTRTETVSLTSSTFATITQAIAVTSTSTMQVVSQFVSVSSNAVVTVNSDMTWLWIVFGALGFAILLAALGIYVYQHPTSPTPPYQYPVMLIPQPQQTRSILQGPNMRFNPNTGLFEPS